MSMQTKTIGRMPTDHGPYDPQLAYGKKFQCTLFGCAWESLHDNNNTAPAVWDGGDVITPNLVDWKKVSGSYEAWLMNKDKPATTGTTGAYPYNGMGRIVIPKKMVNGVNILTHEAFEDSEGNDRENTIYVIRYDFTLDTNITVPANSVLEFDGGSISAGSGENKNTITGNKTRISAGECQIFADNLILDGTFFVPEFKAAWYGLVPNDNTIDWSAKMGIILDNIANIFPLDIWSSGTGRGGIKVTLLPGDYLATTTLNLNKYTGLRGVELIGASNQSTKINIGTEIFLIEKTTTDTPCISLIKNIIILANGIGYGISMISPYHLLIENCKFWGCKIGLRLYLIVDTRIKNCEFNACDQYGVIVSTNAGVGPCTTLYIDDTYFHHCGDAINFSSSQNSQGGINGCIGFVINNCIIEYNTQAIRITDPYATMDSYNIMCTFNKCYFEQNNIGIIGGQVTFNDCVSDSVVSVVTYTSNVYYRGAALRVEASNYRWVTYIPTNKLGELYDYNGGHLRYKRGILGPADKRYTNFLVKYNGDDGYYIGVMDWTGSNCVEVTKIAGSLNYTEMAYFYIGTHNSDSINCSLDVYNLGNAVV